MRSLVTGSHGFVGAYLVAALEAAGHQVRGFDLRTGQDVRNYEQVRSAVETWEPDQLFHLAAVAWPRESLTDPRRTLDVNLAGTLNVLEAVRHTGSHARLLLAGTSEEYGYEHAAVLDEDTVCAPTTPYGVSKLAATTLGMAYARRYGLPVVATRAFNHTGPGRQAVNAEGSFARRIAAFERGETACVTHGDLSAVRNFTDVRDVVSAYQLAITAAPGIYNVCSSQTVTMRHVMDILTAASPGVVLQADPALGSRDQGTFPTPSAAKLEAACGWKAIIPLETTLQDLLHYWRSR